MQEVKLTALCAFAELVKDCEYNSYYEIFGISDGITGAKHFDGDGCKIICLTDSHKQITVKYAPCKSDCIKCVSKA